MLKKLSTLLLTAALAFSMVLPCAATTAHAASAPSKVTVYTYPEGYYYPGSHYGAPITVTLDNKGDKITNLKSNSDKLRVYTVAYGKQSSSRLAKIGCWSKTEGTYKVTFDVVDANDALVKSCAVTVVVKYNSYDYPIKSIKYAGKNNSDWNAITRPKSGKLQITMNKGYKLKYFRVGQYKKVKSSDGYSSEVKYGSKKYKNGSNIKLSNSVYQYSHKSSYSNSTRTNMDADTYIEITYTDKKKKTQTTTTTLIRLVNYVK